MDYGLKGKIAVVTGGSDGIGRATAVQLAREGAKVAICARGQEKLDQTAAEIRKLGGEVLAVSADMSKPADIERFFDAVIKQFGGIDILLNNAGTSQRGAFLEIDDQKWRDDIELKVFGAIRGPFTVVDRTKVLLNLPDPWDAAEYTTSVVVQDERLGEHLIANFDRLWAEAGERQDELVAGWEAR